VGTETVALADAFGRVMADNLVSGEDLPEFYRATMDGYAVRAASTFGASDGNPAFLTVKGIVEMGQPPGFSIGPGEAARISTGGMLPKGADSVVMIEHAEALDETALEVFRSVAPGQHTIEPGEDFRKSEVVIPRGRRLRPQEIGLLAAFGKPSVTVYQKPVIGIISTGDEIVSIQETPAMGQIRDINTYTLSGLIASAGGIPMPAGIVRDDLDALYGKCSSALEKSAMLLISGGSSVGARDFTTRVLSRLPESEILVHGIPIRPGKPTILARSRQNLIWGLPGHVVSAMVVFSRIVRPFVDSLCGRTITGVRNLRIPARLTRNIPSALGRIDYVRVRLVEKEGALWAEPVLGKSALINTMVRADGLVEIDMNTEGLDKGAVVSVITMI
jgi:molybdopterin molybdotransferase